MLSILEEELTNNNTLGDDVAVAVDKPTHTEVQGIEFLRDLTDDVGADSLQNEGDIEDDECPVSYIVPVPKNSTLRDLSLTPVSIMVVDTIGLIPS